MATSTEATPSTPSATATDTDRPSRSPWWSRRGGVPRRPPPGLLEPYDLAVLAAILVAAAASVALGENLLLPRQWMIGHIWTFFFLSGVGLLTLLSPWHFA